MSFKRIFSLIFGLLMLLALPAMVLAEDEPVNVPIVVDEELFAEYLKSQGQPSTIPKPGNVDLFKEFMKRSSATALDPYEVGVVPVLQASVLSELLPRARKNRIDVATTVATGSDRGEPAILTMLANIWDNEAALEGASRLLTKAGTVDAMAAAMNQLAFGYPKPQDHQFGYRIQAMNSRDPFEEDYQLFYRRIKKNTTDRYPLVAEVDRSILYPGMSGSTFVLVNGYLEAEDGSLIYVYFTDPTAAVQDARWQGLKYCRFEEFLEAILHSTSKSYIW